MGGDEVAAGPGISKREGELAYWRGRQDAEGELANSWYERFYTGHFRLTHDDYVGKRVLDIGCGPRGSLEWADMTAERVGLDPLADDYLALGAAGHAMTYVASGAEDMPFDDASFDIVCSFNSLDHVDDPDAVIEEIKRVTCFGGLLLMMSDVHRRPTPQEPILLPWHVHRQFEPEFRIQLVEHLEKREPGTYQSVEAGVPFDHADPTDRYGVVTARMVRVDPDTWWPGGPVEEPAEEPDEEVRPPGRTPMWRRVLRRR